MNAQLVFGKYEIQHRLAVGGMGEVFYAMQRGISGFERPVILKSLLPDLAAQQTLVDQFLDEARVAATLNHPNVVSIFEVGLWNGTYFIAMEYIRGRNLAQLRRKAVESGTDVPRSVVAKIIADAALGLHHAHIAQDSEGRPLGIVHRDISPQNIMVRDDGVTKVVDFGIARAANRSSRTATGTLKGKLSYMAPEQIHGGDSITPAVDQFALGICFWELLTGQRLFKAETDVQILRSVLEQEIPPPSTLRPDITPAMDAVVMRMLEREIAKRYASLADAAAAISALQEEPVESPARFMRRLGTEDLKISIRRTASSSDNFVISLKDAPNPLHERKEATGQIDIDISLATQHGAQGATKQLPSNPSLEHRLTSNRTRYAVIGAVLGLMVLGGAVWFSTRPPPAPVDTALPPVVPVVAAPEPPPTVEPAKQEPPTPVVAPAPARFSIVTEPPGATLRFDGKPVGPTPQVVEGSPDELHYFQFELRGYQRAEKDVSGKSGETLELNVKLERVKVGPPGPPVVTPTPPIVTLQGDGWLRINTTPWAQISVDGENYGMTPTRFKLSPGKHKLRLINQGEGIDVTKEIIIASGQETKTNLKLK